MRSKEYQAIVTKLHKPDSDLVYKNSYLKPHPSKRGSARLKNVKKGWAFSFIVNVDGYDAPASSVELYDHINAARAARVMFLIKQNKEYVR